MTRPLARLFALWLTCSVACAPPVRAQAQPPRPEGGRLFALLVNGGGSAAQNYQSHLLHLRELLDLLTGRGLPRERIAVLSSDGDDPAADLAVRATSRQPDLWLLDGTDLEPVLREPVVLRNSEIPGWQTLPATRASLRKWFSSAKGTLRAGDTLLLYVTDHGTRGEKDPRNNEITLWGTRESITVDQLGELLKMLDPGVRVVSLMSQCFSGGFARLHEQRPGGFCGYFSSTADRPAYGCYPENFDKQNVGHSFHFFEALRTEASFAQAHRQVLTTDQTPDVPLATSEVFLQDLLARAAAAGKRPLSEFADQLLAEAWKDSKTWEPEIRLLDRIGQRFGIWSPRSLAELERLAGALPAFAKSVDTHKDAWEWALGDLNVGRLMRLRERQPEWKGKLDPKALGALGDRERQDLAGRLLPALAKLELYRDRLQTIHERSEVTSALAYRLEVRQAVVLRVRARLLAVAARVYLARHGSAEDRRRHASLTACEDLRLPGAPAPAVVAESRASFPPFSEDVELARKVLPAWMGIGFAPIEPDARRRHGLDAGAALVNQVYPGSPAEAAGLRPGDIVLGPAGKPFTEHNEVRYWTFLSTPGTPQPLDLLRGRERVTVTFVPGTYPGQLPKLPGPPKPSTPAPVLSLQPYRGKLPAKLAGGTPHLLFFWATFCGPCKQSLPEVLAFARARKVPVIAVSDEPTETLDQFFAGWKQPFPEIVAHDDLRRTNIAYGTSGVPTFVFVDGGGVIRSHLTGYSPDRGIGVPGWTYTP
jgi:thiol-disulfide isomerase/thioredoxin